MTQYTPYTIKTSLKSILFIPQKSAGVFFLLLLQKLLFATVTANERDLFIASYTDKKRNAHNKNILYLCQQKKKTRNARWKHTFEEQLNCWILKKQAY